MKPKKDLWGGEVGDAWWAVLVPPAPGDLRIVQAMVNTTSPARDTEELASPLATYDWLVGLLPSTTEVSETDHRRLIDARDGLGALARYNAGLTWGKGAVAGLNEAMALAPLKVSLGGRSPASSPPPTASTAGCRCNQ